MEHREVCSDDVVEVRGIADAPRAARGCVMSDVVFVFSNPRHHLEMMAPVAAELGRRNVRCSLVSLAELRGFDTPETSGARRAIPFNLRRRNGAGPSARPRPPQPSRSADPVMPVASAESARATGASAGGAGATAMAGAGAASGKATAAAGARASTAGDADGGASWTRGLAQRLVWSLGLGPRLRWMLHGARVVVIPNDAVFPYFALVGQLHRRGVRTVLMQEGIRFPQLESYTGPRYGASVSSAVCAWGEGSKDFFIGFSGVPEGRIAVTGAPRLDDLDIESWRPRGDELIAELGLATAPVAFLSNPIDIQGYGTNEAKLALFAQFLAGAAPVLQPRGIQVIVKNHMQEDPADYARIAAASPMAGRVMVLETGPTFAAIAAARAAVVFTSTVGLEALMFGRSIGVLEIPGHEFAFEYVQRGAAVGIRIADVTRGVEQLLAPDAARAEAGQALVRRHLHDRGRARYHVADVIERVLAETGRAASQREHQPRARS
jgi:hypothetical protein